MKTVSAEQLKHVVELANTVPQEFRIKCFELLLANMLQSSSPPAAVAPPTQQPPSPKSTAKPFVLPIDVRAFLSQFRLDESKIWSLFLVEENEVHPIYQLHTVKKAKAQIQLALLMTLQNALRGDQFQVGIEDLRTSCTENKVYDSPNFNAVLRQNKALFKVVDKEQPLTLSPEGKSELADLIEDLNVKQ